MPTGPVFINNNDGITNIRRNISHNVPLGDNLVKFYQDFGEDRALAISFAHDSIIQQNRDISNVFATIGGIHLSVSVGYDADANLYPSSGGDNIGNFYALDVIISHGIEDNVDYNTVPADPQVNGIQFGMAKKQDLYYLKTHRISTANPTPISPITLGGVTMALGSQSELIVRDSGYSVTDINRYQELMLFGVPIRVGMVDAENKYFLIISPRWGEPFELPFTDNFNDSLIHHSWSQVDNTPGTDAVITESADKVISLTVSDCIDTWFSPDDDYAAVYLPVTGDFEAIAKMNSQTGNEWTKCGIMTKIDMSTKGGADATGRKAYSITAATPVNVESSFIFQWDDNDDGYLDQSAHAVEAAVTYPCWLKTTRVDRRITGYYSTDGVNYTQRGTVDFAIPNITDTIDVGIFAGGIVTVGLTTSTTVFDSFTIRSI